MKIARVLPKTLILLSLLCWVYEKTVACPIEAIYQNLQKATQALAYAKIDPTGNLCFVNVRKTIHKIALDPDLDIQKTKALMITRRGLFDTHAYHTRDQYIRLWNYHFVVTYDNWVIDPEFGMIRQVIDLTTYLEMMYQNLDGLYIKEWSAKKYPRYPLVFLTGWLHSSPLSPFSYIGLKQASRYLEHLADHNPRMTVQILPNGIDNHPRKKREGAFDPSILLHGAMEAYMMLYLDSLDSEPTQKEK